MDNQAFLADARKPVSIAVERARGEMASYHTFIHGTPEMKEADFILCNSDYTEKRVFLAGKEATFFM